MKDGFIHIKKPELMLYVRLWMAADGPRAAEAFMPVPNEAAGIGIALNRMDCFAFQTCTRQEVMIDGIPFMTEFAFTKWRAFIGQEFLTGEIAIMGRPESAVLSQKMRQGKIQSACMTRLGTWQPLMPDDRIYDAVSGARMLRKSGSNADNHSGIVLAN